MRYSVLNYFLVAAESTLAAAESTLAAAESTLVAAESNVLAAESTKAEAESTASSAFFSVLLQDAKATVKAKPKKPNFNAFFIF